MTPDRPQANEYASFYNTYISLTGEAPILQTLQELKDSTLQYFISLPEDKGDYTYAEGKWTIKEVTGHLIDCERIFAYRALCISRGEKQLLPGFDQDTYVANANFNQCKLADLAREFETVRQSTLYLLKALTPEQWLLVGNANNHPISVRALAHIIAGHELHHLQILKQRY